MFHIMPKLLIIVAFRCREPRSSRPNFHFPDEGVKSHTSTGCFQLKCIRKKNQVAWLKKEWKLRRMHISGSKRTGFGTFLSSDMRWIVNTGNSLACLCKNWGNIHSHYYFCDSCKTHLFVINISPHYSASFLKSKKMSGKLEIRWLLQYGNSVPLVKWFAQVLYFFFLTTLYI